MDNLSTDEILKKIINFLDEWKSLK
jgi:hypothetical protein